MPALVFTGSAKRLTPDAYTRAAARLQCEEAMVRAFVMTEASGSGYDAAGRPKILFEPHVFYRRLLKSPDQQQSAVHAGVAYPRQGMQPYPRTSDENYARLATACAIDHDNALMSASWGLGQVMGENCQIAGYANVSAFVAAAMESEENQLGFMLSYLEHTGLTPAMRTRAFAVLAHGYNGAGAVAAYSAKLTENYEKALSLVGKAAPAAPVAPYTFAQPKTPVPVQPAPAASTDNVADILNEQEWLRIRAGQP